MGVCNYALRCDNSIINCGMAGRLWGHGIVCQDTDSIWQTGGVVRAAAGSGFGSRAAMLKISGKQSKKYLKLQEIYAIMYPCDESNSLLASEAGQRPKGGNKHEQV